MDKNILNLKAPATDLRLLTVVDITTIDMQDQHGEQIKKINFKLQETSSSTIYNINNAWMSRGGTPRVFGLWLKLDNKGTGLKQGSTLARVLKFYNANTLKDMIGKQVKAYPDTSDYLTILGTSGVYNLLTK